MVHITHQEITVRGINLHVTTAGSGPPIVLLHAWPQTWFEWRELIPTLAEHFFVIAPDLRGLGQSSRPTAGYDKKNIAEDIHELLRHFGINQQPIRLVGHDWGGIVAYIYAALFKVSHLAIIEVILPTDIARLPLLTPDGNPVWHFLFHNVPELPEQLLEGKEEIYLRWWFEHGAAHARAIPEEAIREYVNAYSQPGAMHAALEYYRAIFDDINITTKLAEHPLTMPVLAMGGEHAFGPLVGQALQKVASHVQTTVIAECGHWISEEKPQELAQALLAFLA